MAWTLAKGQALREARIKAAGGEGVKLQKTLATNSAGLSNVLDTALYSASLARAFSIPVQ